MNCSIIPLIDNFSGTVEIIREYGANLEYNDFFSPEVYDNEAEIERLKDRIDARFKEETALKGKALPVKVYSVLGIKKEDLNGR